MYDVVLIDLDNTVLDFDAAESRSFKKIIEKSLPPVKRVARRAGYKPLLLGQRLKALAFTLFKPNCS